MPTLKIKKMAKKAIEAHDRARTISNTLLVVNFYKDNFKLQLNKELIDKFDIVQLEMAYRLMRLEQIWNESATKIQSIYKGILVRREQRRLKVERKKSILVVQAIVRLRYKRRKRKET